MRNVLKTKKTFLSLLFLVLVVTVISINCGGDLESWKEWRVEKDGDLLIISYGSGEDFPQYSVIDLTSSFMRMNYGYGSAWGTSMLLFPSFWERGILYQGATVTTDWQTDGNDVIVYVNGIVSTLSVRIVIRYSPPINEEFTAHVSVSTEGNIDLDDRPGEAYKLVTLASMRTATDYWDARQAFVGDVIADIPVEGWFFPTPVFQKKFGLVGGSSSWKGKSPTIEINLDRNVDINGWTTYSEEPNDDNVGMWGATNFVVQEYTYTVTARP